MNPWFLLHTHSVIAFIMAVTQFGMFIFLYRNKDKSNVIKWIILNYLASAIWYVDQMFRFSLYPKTEGSLIYKIETIFIYAPALALLMLSNFQIFYLFIESKFEKERKIMLRLSFPLSIILIGILSWNEIMNNSTVIVFQAVSFIWGLLTNIGILIIAIRKINAFKEYNRDGVRAFRLLGSAAICFLFLSIVNLIYTLYSPQGYWTFFIFVWLGNLMLMTTYLSYSSVFLSFQVKITGFSLISVVTILIIVTLVFSPPIMPENISARLNQQKDLAKIFFLLIGAMGVILLLVPLLLKQTLTNPLKKLLVAIKAVNSGDLQVEVPELYRDEIGSLTRNFNTMTQTLRQTNEQLLEYTQTLTELYNNQQKIQEQTLNHVSQELHDNVGQLLSLVKIQLNLASEKDGLENQLLIDARENISRAMMDLRDMAKGMSSERIRVLGLLGSVEQEADRIRRTGICDVFITKNGKGLQLDHQKETILFRVIQECLQNIIKHAQATKIEMVFSYDLSHLAIEVHDDGKGFLLTRENNLSGMGLMNIQHRIQLMKGKVLVQSEPGSGTHVRIEVPLEANE